MAHTQYDRSLASSCYINLGEDGSAVAGMILETGNVLIARLSPQDMHAEARIKTHPNLPEHMLTLDREGDNIVRRFSFMGCEMIEEVFDQSIPRGTDFWLGGNRPY